MNLDSLYTSDSFEMNFLNKAVRFTSDRYHQGRFYFSNLSRKVSELSDTSNLLCIHVDY